MIVCFLSLASSITLVLINRNTFDNPPIWNNTKSRDPDVKLCEKPHSSNRLVREPANVYTSLFFLYPALVPLTFLILDWKYKTNSIMSKNPIFSVITIIVNLGHMIGTTVNHMCVCEIGHLSDDFFALLTISLPAFYLIITYGINREKCCNGRGNIYGFSSMIFVLWTLIVAFFLSYGRMISGLNIIPSIVPNIVLLVISIFFIIIPSIVYMYKKKEYTSNRSLFWAAFVFFIIGMFCAIADPYLCPSDSFGLHSLWHVFGSIALVLLYLHQWTIAPFELSNKDLAAELSKKSVV